MIRVYFTEIGPSPRVVVGGIVATALFIGLLLLGTWVVSTQGIEERPEYAIEVSRLDSISREMDLLTEAVELAAIKAQIVEYTIMRDVAMFRATMPELDADMRLAYYGGDFGIGGIEDSVTTP